MYNYQSCRTLSRRCLRTELNSYEKLSYLIAFIVFVFSVQPVNAQQTLYKKVQLGETSSSTTPSSILPVILTKLSAKVEGKQLVVDWQTTNEVNNSYFEVLASTDGIQFKLIGRVDSKSVGGSSAKPLDYQFSKPLNLLQLAGFGLLGLLLLPTVRRQIMKAIVLVCCVAIIAACAKDKVTDEEEDGEVYIQLKQVDLDGKSMMSQVVFYRYKSSI